MYALVKENTFEKFVDLRREFSNISFPNLPEIPDMFLPPNVVRVEVESYPSNVDEFKNIKLSDAPVFEEGRWILKYEVTDINDVQRALLREIKINEMRSMRDTYLREHVDMMNPIRWGELSTTSKNKWIDYRKKLLDVPQQNDFPWNVTWPQKPE